MTKETTQSQARRGPACRTDKTSASSTRQEAIFRVALSPSRCFSMESNALEPGDDLSHRSADSRSVGASGRHVSLECGIGEPCGFSRHRSRSGQLGQVGSRRAGAPNWTGWRNHTTTEELMTSRPVQLGNWVPYRDSSSLWYPSGWPGRFRRQELRQAPSGVL